VRRAECTEARSVAILWTRRLAVVVGAWDHVHQNSVTAGGRLSASRRGGVGEDDDEGSWPPALDTDWTQTAHSMHSIHWPRRAVVRRNSTTNGDVGWRGCGAAMMRRAPTY